MEKGAYRRRGNLPMAHEVALLIPGEDDKQGNHDLILTKRPAQSAADQAPTLQQISYIHPLYPTLHYVLLYALSDPGRDFSIEFQNNGGIRKRLKVSAQVFTVTSFMSDPTSSIRSIKPVGCSSNG
jgi:hypothetical protein